jgi:F420-non-reducing hydrogenase large subunit
VEEVLKRVQLAHRAYDPCFACASHCLPGQMPLEVVVRDAQGEVLAQLRQNC